MAVAVPHLVTALQGEVLSACVWSLAVSSCVVSAVTATAAAAATAQRHLRQIARTVHQHQSVYGLQQRSRL